jgi:hypothetical protein
MSRDDADITKHTDFTNAHHALSSFAVRSHDHFHPPTQDVMIEADNRRPRRPRVAGDTPQ